MSMAQKTWQEQMAENESADGSDLAEESERIGEAEEKVYVASYAKLMWWRFLRHKAAVVSAVIISLLQSLGTSAGDATAADLVWRAASYVPQIIIGIIALITWFKKANEAFASVGPESPAAPPATGAASS